MNKPVYLGFSVLELTKILMYEFWHDYDYILNEFRCDYGKKSKLCDMDESSFIL